MAPGQPRIAIIGGGPGGLTLGGLLHKRGVPFTIYELGPRPSEEELSEPSGMLDLHEESGLAAICACGLYEAFFTFTGDCEESMIVANKHGNILYADKGEGASRPEIARHNIVRLFLSILPEESIRFGTKLVSATRNPRNSEVILELESTVAKGITTLATYDLVVGKGSFIALGNKHGVDSHRAAQDSSQIYVFLNAPGQDEAVESLSKLSIPELNERVLNDESSFADYSPSLKELMAVAFDEEARTGGEIPIRSFPTLPIGHRWEQTPGVTLIGDAAHLMHPAGEGVNLAMWDALDLSAAIADAWEESVKNGGESFTMALSKPMMGFENVMFARAQEKAEMAKILFETMFSEDGAQGLADIMKGFFEWAQPQ